MSSEVFVSAFDLLGNDPSGYGHKQLKEEVFQMQYTVKRAMDSGLSSEDMEVAKAALIAVNAADDAVTKFYDRHNS